MTKKWQHRKCQRCKIEYCPARDAQSYCSRECRRQAAYGRERFKAGTKGRRKRRLEASDNLLHVRKLCIAVVKCQRRSAERKETEERNPSHLNPLLLKAARVIFNTLLDTRIATHWICRHDGTQVVQFPSHLWSDPPQPPHSKVDERGRVGLSNSKRLVA